MLPIQFISGLFTATIVGATAGFVKCDSYLPIEWFMYLYLIAYRVKVYLDDLVYYQNIKQYAVGGGDPIIGLFSWILWIVIGMHIRNEIVYFGLTSATFGIGVIWILIAKRNVRKIKSFENKEIIIKTQNAHKKWFWFNFIPFLVGGVYFWILLVSKTIDWNLIVSWIGPLILTVALIIDIVTDFKYMFQIE